jgi:catechol 2,3-dioxygenase
MTPDSHSDVGRAPSGYRLPAATRLGRMRLQVADLARSLDFYEGVLGLRVIDGVSGRAVLAAQDDDRPLVELIEKEGVRPVPRRGLIGLYHVAYLLPDRAALGRFVRHVAGLGIPLGSADHLVSEALYLSDPDGLGVEVYADRPRSAWRVEGRQIVMATDPLDLHDLAAAAGDTRWSGAPAGTTVGHVHLHVGDLDQAAAFYHEALGLDKIVWGYPGALFLSAGGYHHHLGTNVWAAGAPPAGEGDARLLDWTLVLPERDDVEAAVDSLARAGHRGDADRRVADPWGTVLRLATTD